MESGATPKPKRPRRRLANTYDLYWKKNGTVTPETLAEVERYLLKGLPIIHICGLVGLSEESYYKWLRFGKAYFESDDPLPHHEHYGAFYQMHHRATAAWQMDIIDRSLTGDQYKAVWVRDMTILERRDRANWGRDDKYNGQRGGADPDMKFV